MQRKRIVIKRITYHKVNQRIHMNTALYSLRIQNCCNVFTFSWRLAMIIDSLAIDLEFSTANRNKTERSIHPFEDKRFSLALPAWRY